MTGYIKVKYDFIVEDSDDGVYEFAEWLRKCPSDYIAIEKRMCINEKRG